VVDSTTEDEAAARPWSARPTGRSWTPSGPPP